jgi:hypothetical protein
MSDAPLFQNSDEQEAAYASEQPVDDGMGVGIPAAGLGVGTGSPAAGAGTPGVLPSAIALQTRSDGDLTHRGDTVETDGKSA